MSDSSDISLSDMVGRAGALALLEQDELDPDEPGFGQIPTVGPTRASDGDAGRWRAFVQRLRGYERGPVLFTDLPVWIPLVELTPPVGGSATVTCQCSTKAEGKAKLTVFGSGFGNTITASLDQVVEVTARGAPLEVAAQVHLTAQEYRSSGGGPPLIRVDVVRMEPATRVRDTSPRPSIPSPPPPEYEVIDTVLLASATHPGSFTWRRRAVDQSTWNIALGPSIKAVGLELKLDISVTKGQQFETSFELPFGHDYIVYLRADAPRLVPLCAPIPTR